MTTPLSSFGKVVEGARLIVRQSSPLYPPQQPPALVTVTEWAVSKLDEQVAALPRPDDPEAVEALAKWLWAGWASELRGVIAPEWDKIQPGDYYKPRFIGMARAIITELCVERV